MTPLFLFSRARFKRRRPYITWSNTECLQRAFRADVSRGYWALLHARVQRLPAPEPRHRIHEKSAHEHQHSSFITLVAIYKDLLYFVHYFPGGRPVIWGAATCSSAAAREYSRSLGASVRTRPHWKTHGHLPLRVPRAAKRWQKRRYSVTPILANISMQFMVQFYSVFQTWRVCILLYLALRRELVSWRICSKRTLLLRERTLWRSVEIVRWM